MTANARPEIQKRIASGGITLAGPLIMLVARSVLAIVCQGLVAMLFFRGRADAWTTSGDCWRVYGSAIDLGTIALLIWLTRREGIRLLDLGNYLRERWPRDVLIGLGLFVPIFALTMFLPGPVIGGLIYGGPVPVSSSPLPLAGLLYTLVVWPVIWAFAEDNAYFGYALPRLEALTGRRWIAVTVVTTFAALQHSFLPFELGWKHAAYRFLTSVPVILVLCLLYLRQRRLLPIHIIHWAGNVIGVIMLMIVPPGGG